MSDASMPQHESEVRVAFHHQLDEMDDAFVTAALEVAQELPRLTRAFLDGDDKVIDEAVDLSVGIGARVADIEERGFVLLARESPVAGDLRRLVAMLRLTTDIDRSAALVKHVCLTLQRFDPRGLPEDLRTQLTELADRSATVFREGIEAWRRRDAHAVSEVDEADEGVDRLQELLLEAAARREHDAGDAMLVLGLIARYYERIADHGVAVAQDAAFVATGQRVKVGKQRRREGGSAESA